MLAYICRIYASTSSEYEMIYVQLQLGYSRFVAQLVAHSCVHLSITSSWI